MCAPRWRIPLVSRCKAAQRTATSRVAFEARRPATQPHLIIRTIRASLFYDARTSLQLISLFLAACFFSSAYQINSTQSTVLSSSFGRNRTWSVGLSVSVRCWRCLYEMFVPDFMGRPMPLTGSTSTLTSSGAATAGKKGINIAFRIIYHKGFGLAARHTLPCNRIFRWRLLLKPPCLCDTCILLQL